MQKTKTMNLIYLIVGVVIGIVAGIFIGYARRQSLIVRAELQQKQIESLEKQHLESLEIQRQRFDLSLIHI